MDGPREPRVVDIAALPRRRATLEPPGSSRLDGERQWVGGHDEARCCSVAGGQAADPAGDLLRKGRMEAPRSRVVYLPPWPSERRFRGPPPERRRAVHVDAPRREIGVYLPEGADPWSLLVDLTSVDDCDEKRPPGRGRGKACTCSR